MTTLGAPAGLDDTTLTFDAAYSSTADYPIPMTVDSENVELIGGKGSRVVSVRRGMNGTTQATHAIGATVMAGWGGAGGSGVTVDNGVDAPAAVTTLVAPGADVSTPGEATLSSAQIYVADDDPGAVGARNLWVQTDPDDNFNTLQVWVRNDADAGWLQASLGSSYTFTNGDAGIWDAATGRQRVGIQYDADGITLQSWQDVTDAATKAGITIGALAIGVFGMKLYDGTGERYLLMGTADPSAGAGIEAPAGSTFQRDNAGAGEFWCKTGAADTAWTKLTS